MILSSESQKKTRLQALLLLGVVFILGCVTGAALNGLYRLRANADNSSSNRPSMLERMRSDLNLNNEQAERIRTLLDESRKEFHKRLDECGGVKDARQRSRDSIRALLNEEQKKKFDEITARRDAERKAREAK